MNRGVAQLGERVVWDHEVARSNRVTPTKRKIFLKGLKLLCFRSFFIYKFYCFFNCIWERPKKAVICYFALLAFVSLSQPFSQLLTFNSPKFSLLSFGELKITLQIYREKYCINSNIIKVIIRRVPIYSPFI